MQILDRDGPRQRIDVVRFSPAGDSLLAVGNGSWLDVWDFPGATHRSRLLESNDPKQTILGVEYLSDGVAIAAITAFGGLRIQPCVPDSPIPAAHQDAPKNLFGLAVCPNGRQIIGSSVSSAFGYHSWLLDGEGHCALVWYRELKNIRPGWPTFSPDSSRFAASEMDLRGHGHTPGHGYCIFIRSADNGEEIAHLVHKYREIRLLRYSPNGEWFIAAVAGSIFVWPADLSGEPRVIKNDNRRHFTDIAFHPSGRFLAATSNDETVKFYDTSTWALASTFTWKVGKMRCLAFSPDGLVAAAGSETGQVVVWDYDL
jgi:WD40 repeat protein